jgi:DNA-binding HxlR family transcriptional regulator
MESVTFILPFGDQAFQSRKACAQNQRSRLDQSMKKQQPYTCGLGPALDIIGGKWKILILWEISEQPRRFGELKRLVIGISEKMLIQQLREMEADGIVKRQVFHEIPPHVEYSLTELGASLKQALAPLCAWGEQHMELIAGMHPTQIGE